MSAAAAARARAARVVLAVRHGRSLDTALAEAFAQLPPELERERALIQELSYGAIRWHYQLAQLVAEWLDRPLKPKDDDLAALLAIGLYQLLYMRLGAHAAVNETVEATTVLDKPWAKGMVNAVLRRALRERESIDARLAADETLALAHPRWLLDRLQAAWPQHWRAIAQANNARPPLTLRVNRARTSRPDYLARLAEAGIAARAPAEIDDAVVLETPLPVERLPGFADGLVSVQDGAAQLAAALLDVAPGQRVLDACAAPGGKAAHVLELEPGTNLTAIDVDAARLERVRETFVRLGLRGGMVCGDAAEPGRWWDRRPFERILLDAPCSGSGVIRRHPDIRLHRTKADLGRLAATQARLLDALWPLLAPGGKLLYVTCSVLPEENRLQIAQFCARTPGVRTAAPPHPALARYAHADGLGFQLLPGAHDLDGFYFAALVRET